MPYYSLFWDRHYDDFPGRCMTDPISHEVFYKGRNRPVYTFVDTQWMRNKKMKWIGWDADSYVCWVTPGGMMYRIDDLKRSELGKEYEKDEQKIRCEPEPGTGIAASSVPMTVKEYNEQNLSILINGGWCFRGRGITDGDSDAESSRGGGLLGRALNGRDAAAAADGWQQYAQGNYDPTGEIQTNYAAENFGQYGASYSNAQETYDNAAQATTNWVGDNDSENLYIPTLPVAPPTSLPTLPGPYTPPVNIPPPFNPIVTDASRVLDASKILDTSIVLDSRKVLASPFGPKKSKLTNIVGMGFGIGFEPQGKNKEDEDCPKEGGLYIPLRKGILPKDSDEFKVLRQIAGNFSDNLTVDENGHVNVPYKSDEELYWIDGVSSSIDGGYQLLRNIANNGKNMRFQFSVGNSIKGRRRGTNEQIEYSIYNGSTVKKVKYGPHREGPDHGSQDMNLSKNERKDNPRGNTQIEMDLWEKANGEPVNCFQGSIVIPSDPTGLKDTNGSILAEKAEPKKQASMAFHALAENYLRTIDSTWNFIDNAVHKKASDMENKLPKGHPARSQFPGFADYDWDLIKKYQDSLKK